MDKHKHIDNVFLFAFMIKYNKVSVGVVVNNNSHLEIKEAFKRELKSMQSWCCSFWAYLHVFMFILLAISGFNAFIRYDQYRTLGDVLLLIGALVFGVGIFVAMYGLYGMYNCVPVAFLLLTIYIIIDIVIDLMIIFQYGFGARWNYWTTFWLVTWAIYAWPCYRLYEAATTFKKSRM